MIMDLNVQLSLAPCTLHEAFHGLAAITLWFVTASTRSGSRAQHQGRGAAAGKLHRATAGCGVLESWCGGVENAPGLIMVPSPAGAVGGPVGAAVGRASVDLGAGRRRRASAMKS